MGPRAAMKPSGKPIKKNRTQAVRRARALFGRLRLGPRGSANEGRGRLREPAIGSLSTRCVPIKATAIISREIIATRLASREGAPAPALTLPIAFRAERLILPRDDA